MTPVQANHILHTKSKIDENHYAFWLNEFRTINFFSIKGGMSETKQIKKPSDLYPLHFDSQEKKFTRKQLEFFDRKLTPEEIRIIKGL